MAPLQKAALCLALALALPALEAQDLGGMDESAIGDDDSVVSRQVGTADAATCECADSGTWASPDNGGLCSTYRVGGVNEGYCDIDEAYTACPSACDACPACSGGLDGEVAFAMLWLGLPCIFFALCAPFLNTVLFYLKDDRITIQQAEKDSAKAVKDGAQLLGVAPLLRTGSAAAPDANLLRESYGGASALSHDQMARQINERALGIFQQLDTDQSGFIEFTEFQAALNGALGDLGYPPEQMLALFNQADVDGSGTISYVEFCQNLMVVHSAHMGAQIATVAGPAIGGRDSTSASARQQQELGV